MFLAIPNTNVSVCGQCHCNMVLLFLNFCTVAYNVRKLNFLLKIFIDGASHFANTDNMPYKILNCVVIDANI